MLRKRVSNHFSEMYGPILFLLGTKTTHDGAHKHIILFHDAIKDGRLAAILLLQCVPNHVLDIHGPILFKLGTSKAYDGIHVHLTLFCNLIKDGRLVDRRQFSFLKKPDVEHVLNHFSDTHFPMLLKLGTCTVHDGIHVHLTLFCDLLKDD